MKNSTATSRSTSTELVYRLPSTAFTRSGIAFQPIDDVWHWVDGPFVVHIDFSRLSLPADFPSDSLKHTLVVFAKRSSASHLSNMFQAFWHFLSRRNDATPLTGITSTEVSNYSARLEAHEVWRLGALNVLLQKWTALGLQGVEPSCTQYLRERRKPGNVKGKAVRTHDPLLGPFSEAEYTALYRAVDASYGEGETQLCVKGEEHKESNLRLLLEETQYLLMQAREALSDEEYGADTWVAHQTKTLERVSALLAVLDNPEVPVGARVRLNLSNAELITNATKVIPADKKRLSK